MLRPTRLGRRDGERCLIRRAESEDGEERDPEMPRRPHSSVQSALRREWTPMKSPITFTHPPRELPFPRTCWFGPCLRLRLLRLMWPLNLLLSPIRDPDIAPIRLPGWRATTSALNYLVPLTTTGLADVTSTAPSSARSSRDSPHKLTRNTQRAEPKNASILLLCMPLPN